MMKKCLGAAIVVLGVAALICSVSFAMCGTCGADDTAVTKGKASSKLVKINNTICPVTGDKVNMKNPVTIEHNGKIYNLCCPACVSAFKSDPEKYAAKAEAEMKK